MSARIFETENSFGTEVPSKAPVKVEGYDFDVRDRWILSLKEPADLLLWDLSGTVIFK